MIGNRMRSSDSIYRELTDNNLNCDERTRIRSYIRHVYGRLLLGAFKCVYEYLCASKCVLPSNKNLFNSCLEQDETRQEKTTSQNFKL